MDPTELDHALREQLPALRRFAGALVRDPPTADDLVQATLERAIASWSRRRKEEALKPWLFAILHRQFLDHRRRARRYAWLLARAGDPDGATHPSAEREAIARSTLEAFQRLPFEQRTLLLWISVEGLSYQDVADILGVPIGTVMSRLSRARHALRRLSEEGAVPQRPLRVMK